MSYAILADTVLAIHFGVVVFVVGGLVLIPVGNALRWQWVNRWTFRLLHASAIVVITVQAWLGQHCPLTVLEAGLRARAGAASRYEVSFVQYWLERLMYFQASPWVFAVIYTVFAGVVALAWWRYPPQPRRVGPHGSS